MLRSDPLGEGGPESSVYEKAILLLPPFGPRAESIILFDKCIKGKMDDSVKGDYDSKSYYHHCKYFR